MYSSSVPPPPPATAVWHLKCYGTRGSTPVSDPDYQQFGGNTSCIYADLLTNDRSKMIIVFDAGSGIRRLGKDIQTGVVPQVETIWLMFTHFHWDHIQGLPFFDPAYDPEQKIGLFAPHERMKEQELKQIFETQMQEEYFPVPFSKMGAEFRFATFRDYRSAISADGETELTYRLHQHPGGAFSYRLSAGGKSFVLCTDLEHGETLDSAVVEFCRGADLLIHDAQYTDEELTAHRGWGHSSYTQAMEVARRAGVGRLVFTHHDPDHDDAFLTAMEEKCQAVFPNCSMARDGMDIYI